MITQQLILDWFAVVMTPIGIPIDASAFYNPSITVEGALPVERHNVDKNMLAQDLSLITVEVTFKARIATAQALACLMVYWPAEVIIFTTILMQDIDILISISSSSKTP